MFSNLTKKRETAVHRICIADTGYSASLSLVLAETKKAASHTKRPFHSSFYTSPSANHLFVQFRVQVLLLNSDGEALRIVSFRTFDNRIIPVRSYLNGVPPF